MPQSINEFWSINLIFRAASEQHNNNYKPALTRVQKHTPALFFALWPSDSKTGFQDSLWTLFTSSLVILAASVLRYHVNKQTNKQTNKHINAAEHPTHTTVIGVVKNIKKKEQRQPLLLLLLYYHVQFLLNRPSFLDDCSVLLHC